MTQGILYIVATPIGNLQDCSMRAIQILKQVDLIAAEDTRHSRRLLDQFGITTPLYALHEHNEYHHSQTLTSRLLSGTSIALISDAGTPLISDPGYYLVAACHQAGIVVSPIPGASALISALSAAGMPADRFVFEGFLAAKSGARCKQLEALRQESRTLVFYETPHRIVDSVADMIAIFGAAREVVMARELTKVYETIHRSSLGELFQWLQQDTQQQKGEFVLVIAGAPPQSNEEIPAEAVRIFHLLREELPLKQAAKLTSQITGIHRNQLYALGLQENPKETGE
ncbi:16S rRNA (cytidine(1402)-2'-O)-methyltransferase [Thioflexithrix psekupsensis]|uniref:Ribosomal RNA small subunit methyltransferase I n=1 Tax=Thioflexithrix psekupsensis TaxID=1570016 RepID=A0A251XAZ2_9GAMM|nr:16S rRNA (cytidine(1402)-2'-O)-methyltransferase [Thioflexithrix psekupsensis]OUD15473.1 16S rRNA (cytidine(1402)-2'-O)-methyltransferase [Thioflexithrix psekupsensis]